jgi:hypothetical protein
MAALDDPRHQISAKGRPAAWGTVGVLPATCGIPGSSECRHYAGTSSYPRGHSIQASPRFQLKRQKLQSEAAALLKSLLFLTSARYPNTDEALSAPATMHAVKVLTSSFGNSAPFFFLVH